MGIPIIVAIVIILYLCLCVSDNTLEGYRTYKPINEIRHDMCQVYADSFYDSQLNTDNRVTQRMLDWCYNWKKRSNDYPSWRSAERAFLKLKQMYGSSNSSSSSYSRSFLPSYGGGGGGGGGGDGGNRSSHPPITGLLEHGFPSKYKSTLYNSNVYNNYNNYNY